MKGIEAINKLKKKRDELHWWQIIQRFRYNRAITQLIWMNEKFNSLEVK